MLYDPKWETPAETKPLRPWQKLLLDGAAYIETHGWCQNKLRNAGGVCYVGAMIQVDCKTGEYDLALRKIQTHLGVPCIIDWNNAAGRTKQEVIEAMRSCANGG
jgi:hypothetical protein